jgi:hypothetical protein
MKVWIVLMRKFESEEIEKIYLHKEDADAECFRLNGNKTPQELPFPTPPIYFKVEGHEVIE